MSGSGGPGDVAALRQAGEAIVAASRLAEASLVAIGWATIDLDGPAEPPATMAAADDPTGLLTRDELLGARVRRVGSADGIAVVLLEPDTEGRLAASLARFGEGAAVVWVASRRSAPDPIDELRQRGITLSRPAEGPFGTERLVVGGPPAGPHVLVLE